jgi:hypothetical protein
MRRISKDAPTKIGDLFEVYKKRLRAPEGSVTTAVSEVVHDLLGVTLDKKNLTYSPQTKILTIKASGMVKTEIMLRKEEILTHLKGRLGPKSAPSTIL